MREQTFTCEICGRCGSLLRESEAYYDNSDKYDERPHCSSCFHSLV